MSDEGRQPTAMPPYDPAQWIPQPPPAPPARNRGRKVLIIIGIVVLALAVLGAGGYMLVKSMLGSAEKLGAQYAEPVLVHLRDGNSAAIYAEAAPAFQQSVPKAKLDDILSTNEKMVGRPVSWKLVGYNVQTFAGSGTTRTFTYDVTNQRGKSQVLIRLGDDNRLLYLNFKWN